jgi:hypothetical protein
VTKKLVFGLIARFIQTYGAERLLVDAALESVKHLETLRTLYACANNVQIQYLYRSCITLKSSHPNGTSGDRATHREFDRVLLELIKRVWSEEAIVE